MNALKPSRASFARYRILYAVRRVNTQGQVRFGQPHEREQIWRHIMARLTLS